MPDAPCGCDHDIRTARWWRLGPVALAVVWLLVAGAVARAADPNFERPRVGACHGLGLVDITCASDPSQPVSCGGFHTTRTIAVVGVPAGLDLPRSGQTGGAALVVAGRCHAAWRRVLGSTARVRAMSAFRVATFVPTTAQRRRGARWVRCDLMRVGGGRLLALPAQVRLGGLPLPDRFAVCVSPRLTATACSEPHVLRAVTAFTLKMSSSPGFEVLQAETVRRCPENAGVIWIGAFPLEWQWRVGDRVAVCFGFEPVGV